MPVPPLIAGTEIVCEGRERHFIASVMTDVVYGTPPMQAMMQLSPRHASVGNSPVCAKCGAHWHRLVGRREPEQKLPRFHTVNGWWPKAVLGVFVSGDNGEVHEYAARG